MGIDQQKWEFNGNLPAKMVIYQQKLWFNVNLPAKIVI